MPFACRFIACKSTLALLPAASRASSSALGPVSFWVRFIVELMSVSIWCPAVVIRKPLEFPIVSVVAGSRPLCRSLNLVRIISLRIRASSSFVLFSRALGGCDFSVRRRNGSLPYVETWPRLNAFDRLGYGDLALNRELFGPLPVFCLTYSCKLGTFSWLSRAASSHFFFVLSSAAWSNGLFFGVGYVGLEKPELLVISRANVGAFPLAPGCFPLLMFWNAGFSFMRERSVKCAPLPGDLRRARGFTPFGCSSKPMTNSFSASFGSSKGASCSLSLSLPLSLFLF